MVGPSDSESSVLVLEEAVDSLGTVGSIERLGLTDREVEVVELLADGLTNGEIAVSLAVSPRTIQRHLENVYDKLGVRTRAGAVGKLLRG